jgi:hypothetical protein
MGPLGIIQIRKARARESANRYRLAAIGLPDADANVVLDALTLLPDRSVSSLDLHFRAGSALEQLGQDRIVQQLAARVAPQRLRIPMSGHVHDLCGRRPGHIS